MQESVAFPPPLKSSSSRFSGFSSSFDSALSWDGAIPPVTSFSSIESIIKDPDAYEKLVVIGYSLQNQIGNNFSDGTTSVRSEVEWLINSVAGAGSPSKLEISLKKKAVIVKLLQLVISSRAWFEADRFFWRRCIVGRQCGYRLFFR